MFVHRRRRLALAPLFVRNFRRRFFPRAPAALLVVAMAVALCAVVAGHRPQRAAEVRTDSVPATSAAPKPADFGTYAATPAAHRVADWAIASDAGGGPFIIVDKPAAAIYVFDSDGRVRGSAPVLLGAAIGDDTVSGIGDKPLDKVLPQEKTTPAGRFIGEPGRNARGEDVIWVDYDAAVSMHRVITFNAAERRLERLKTPAIDDNRISYGCINIPVEFYEAYVRPAYAQRNAVVYVLPEVKALNEIFPLGNDASAGQRQHPGTNARLAALR
jgi:hypothetical protein